MDGDEEGGFDGFDSAPRLYGIAAVSDDEDDLAQDELQLEDPAETETTSVDVFDIKSIAAQTEDADAPVPVVAETEVELDASIEVEGEEGDDASVDEDEMVEKPEVPEPIDYSLGFGTFGGIGYDPSDEYISMSGQPPPAGFTMPKNAFQDAGFGNAGTIEGLVKSSIFGSFGGFGDGFGI